MKLRNILVGLTSAVLLFPTPPLARVEASTQDLLKVMMDNGIQVTVNDPEVCDGTYHGKYQWAGMKRWMFLCPGEVTDAADHDTVRHEAVHANSTLYKCCQRSN